MDHAAVASYADRLALWRARPDIYVRERFHAEPDIWQDEGLRLFPTSPRLGFKAAKGPGKSCEMAWIGWNFLETRFQPNCAAVSISKDNLRDGLAKEMALWHGRSPELQALFDVRNERIQNKRYPRTWFMSFRAFARDADVTAQEATLAGLHSDQLLFLLDETGSMPSAVMAAADAGLANALGPRGEDGRYTFLDGKEAHIVQSGNPLENDGPLYRACREERELWDLIEITGDPDDPKRAKRISITWAREQIQRFGRNNPWVLANVFGRFPPKGLRALLAADQVADAMRRVLLEHSYRAFAKVIGVDVALEGDDRTVIWKRQGPFNHEPIVLRNLEPDEIAARVAEVWYGWGADACFVDNSGGYGSGVVNHLELLNLKPYRVNFSGSARDPRFDNIRAQMHWEAAQSVKHGCRLSDTYPEIVKELTTMRYGLRGGRFYIEDKKHVKERLGFSPDMADAFGLTFAAPVMARDRRGPGAVRVAAARKARLREARNRPDPRER